MQSQTMIHIYKCDGSLSKTIEEYYCIKESSDFWVFFLFPLKTKLIKSSETIPVDISKVQRKKRCSLITNQYPTFLFFWKERWFHIALTLMPDNKHNLLVKISTPPLIEEKAFKYIDFDLTLSLNEEKELELLNNELYLENSQKMKYTPNLKKEISKTIREIFQMLKANWFEKLTEENWFNSLWEKVLKITQTDGSEFYKNLKDEKREELIKLGIEIGTIN